MSYAIISVGGKQYRVREGQHLLVDRLAVQDGESFEPRVLLVGGGDAPAVAPSDVTVTAKVLGQEKGPKLLIGKYKKRTGYKRHTGFRASLTRIQIESIGQAGAKRAPKAQPEAKPVEAPSDTVGTVGLPDGYADMTVADVKAAAASWTAAGVEAALAYERAHGNRKGAIAALESATVEEES